ncbi:MAG: glycosyltransferase family 4 protein, partial [Actinobacteria bacterium]|nr:glycosyltransferase family 4 protein [Actinomycetota bacterium]
MLLAVFLIFIIILVIFNELIIPSFSYRDARRLVRHQHEIAEHPEDESKDPLIELFPEPKQLGDKEEGKRIALIAPYGMHKRMAMRQRIMPIAISLLERGYFINIFIPCWDYALSYSEEQLHRDTGVLIFIRKRHWLPKVFDPILIWRLIRKVIAFQPDIIYCFKPIRYSGIVSIVTYFLRKFHLNRTLCKVKKIIIDEDEWEGFGGWADRIQNPYILRYLRDLQERIALRSCDSVIVGSEELKTRALAIRKGKNNVVVVPNGIMVELWPKRSSIIIPNKLSKRLSQFLHPEPLLLYTRFVEIKAEEIIKILSKVLISIPNAILLIVGTSFEPEGRYQRLKLMSLAKRENIEERIIQAGWIPFR